MVLGGVSMGGLVVGMLGGDGMGPVKGAGGMARHDGSPRRKELERKEGKG
jgi:hypothetical protein